MKALGNVFSGISASFALVPGMAILVTSLGVPPGASRVVFGAAIESACVLLLLLVWANKNKVRRWPLGRVSRYAAALLGVFLLFFAGYLVMYGYYVEEVPHTAGLLFPLWPQGELAEGLLRHSGQAQLVAAWGRDDVYKTIQASSPMATQLTIIVFLVVYLVMFMALTAGFGLLGAKVADKNAPKPPKPGHA